MIKALYNASIYSQKNADTDRGYRIFSYTALEGDDNVEKGDTFTAAGNFLPAVKGPVYYLEGEWAEGKNGLIYKVAGFTEEIPRTHDAIIGYLESGVIKGITPPVAKNIWERFGKSTLDVLDQDPDKLFSLNGIGVSTLLEIRESYEKERCTLPLILWLSKFGVSPDTARFAYEKFGGVQAAAEIKKDPYILYQLGVKLQNCIKIADTLPLPDNHTGLCKAICIEVLRMNETSGDIAMDADAFHDELHKKMQQYTRFFGTCDAAEQELYAAREIVKVGNYIYLKDAYNSENTLARKVAALALSKPVAKKKCDVYAEIAKCEKKFGFSLHENQKKAVKTALSSGVCVITGGPGTGKTTVVRVIRHIFENVLGKKMLFLAPTGRAAARMKESSGYDAYTIHKALKINDMTLMEDNGPGIEEDAVVCDEASMLDIYVARKLFSAIRDGHQIILLGDVNQLPSVGTGKVLSDLIESGVVPVAALTKVYRQASSASRIYLNCQKIIKGNLSLEEGDDFEVVNADTYEESAEKMIKIYLDEIEKFGMDEVCCLCPYRRYTASGSVELNKALQERLNPAESGKPEMRFGTTVFRLGDRVMNRKNTEDACNGDIGVIESIEKGSVKVRFQFSTVVYYKEDLEHLDLAYAMSIHKSQGSEFKSVIVNILPGHGKMLQMNLLNTAISRAKVHCVVVGNTQAITAAIQNRDGNTRLSALKEKIIISARKS